MSGGGGKGGSQTSQTEIPDWIRDPAIRAIDRGERIAEIGYTPYMGPEVAALSQPQMSAMMNTGSAANAFGMGGGDPLAGMPAPQTFAGGMQGYSSYPLYQETQDAFAQAYPGQADYMSSFFIDPQSGVPGNNTTATSAPVTDSLLGQAMASGDPYQITSTGAVTRPGGLAWNWTEGNT